MKRADQKTIISWNEDTMEVTIGTTSAKTIRQAGKMGLTPVSNGNGETVYKCPLHRFKWALRTTRTMSPERRLQAAEWGRKLGAMRKARLSA